MSADSKSLSRILGPWVEPEWESGVIARCREAWNKPLRELSRLELATLLRQRLAMEHLLPVVAKKLMDADDGTELFEGELLGAIENVQS
ncbi:MAG: contact-dependent growth inhibition system immunity protein [Limisphaerales bacterium]